MNIALATDHAGFSQLQQLQIYLESIGHQCKNFGPVSLQPDDDYPDFIFPAADAVASGQFQAGIIMGGSGQGEAMVANRVKGVRCAVFYGPVTAHGAVDAEGSTSDSPYEIIKLSRQHNDANVLSLASRFLDMDQIREAVKTWLDTPFSADERHERRNSKIDSGV